MVEWQNYTTVQRGYYADWRAVIFGDMTVPEFEAKHKASRAFYTWPDSRYYREYPDARHLRGDAK